MCRREWSFLFHFEHEGMTKWMWIRCSCEQAARAAVLETYPGASELYLVDRK